MKIEVRIFAAARELVGQPSLTVDLPDGATVAQLRSHLLETYPQLGPLLAGARFAVGGRYAPEGQLLASQQETALIPPVSGG